MTAAATLVRLRRTQEERSAETRGRLLDATIECLYERGYAGTTTTEIADRAGVSRGAQLHHFRTKAELVTTAVEHLFQRRTEEFREAFRTQPPSADRAAAAIDLLWPMVSGPLFYAWLEVVVAARTDPALRPTVTGIGERFGTTVRQTFLELFPAPKGQNPFFQGAPDFTFALMEGLALGRIIEGSTARSERVLALLKRLTGLAIPGTGDATAGPAPTRGR